MNWNDDNSGSPWGSGNGNNPWKGRRSSKEFEDTINKAKKSLGKFNFGRPKNISFILLFIILIWVASGFYRVEPDEQGVELLFGRWNNATTQPGLHYFFPRPIGQVITPKVEVVRKINVGFRTASDLGFSSNSNAQRSVIEESL